MKTVLITGHKGFIGKNMTKEFCRLEWLVKTFDIKDSPTARPKDLNLDGIDLVIHLGAISSTTEKDVQKLMDLNLSWSIELYERCLELGILMQFASSASVYGLNRARKIMTEEDICYPSNYYALSKYLFEQYALKRNSFGRPGGLQIFRYFNVYGPYEEHKGTQASPFTQFTKQAKETGEIKIFKGSEKIFRDFVHVDTVVSAHIMGEKKYSQYGQKIFNVGTGRPRSFLEVAKDIALHYNAKITEIPFPRDLMEHYQEYTHANTSNLDSLLSIYG